MREQAAIACMICIVGAEDGVDAIVAWGHPQWVFGKVGATLVMSVDVMPCLSIDE